tara:strand:+ start:1263 stop:2534 length:1272 start_codon:yes stop_codon:yes gene_type:complete
MKQLLVFQGPCSSRSGYGDHSRDLVRSLIAMDKFDIKIIDLRWGDCPRNSLSDRDTDISSRILSSNLDRQPDIFVQVSVPNEFQPIGKFNIGITAGIETTVCAPEWIEGCNRMNLIVVPSKHAKTVFEQTYFDKMNKQTKQKEGELRCTTPIEVLFEGADLNIWHKTDEISKTVDDKLKTIPEDFCFLYVGHWLQGDEGHTRKDTGSLIRTFCNTFKGGSYRKRPALILKTSSATFSVMDREDILRKIRAIRNNIPNAPNVYLIHGDLEQVELNSLYNHPKVKAHISFTKGEGFGRPLLEASLSGRPVIATNWSGHVDFLSPHSVLLPGEVRQIHPSAIVQGIMMPESGWFYVNYNYASKVMKDVFKNYKKYLPPAMSQLRHSKKYFSLEQMNVEMADLVNKYVTEHVEIQLPKLQLPKLQKA